MNKKILQSIPDGVAILVFVGCLKQKKAQFYHDELLFWQEYFLQIKVNIYIVSTNNELENKALKEMYHSRLHYMSVNDMDFYREWHVLKSKYVFGKKYEMIYPYMYLLEDKKVLKIYKRINTKTIKSLFLDAIEIQFKRFIKKVEKSIDINSKL